MSKAKNSAALARAGITPRGLNRDEAATYINISGPTFDRLVVSGQMPRPRKIFGRKVWDRLEIDAYFSRLPYDDGTPGESPKQGGDDVWSRCRV